MGFALKEDHREPEAFCPRRHADSPIWRREPQRNDEWHGARSRPRREPSPFQALELAIESSRYIYNLRDDWDDEGADGYEYETWRRATAFLMALCRHAWATTGDGVPVPMIGPGPKGSIDIHWRTGGFELLLNVPRDPAAPAGFYGDDYGNIKIKGTINLASSHPCLIQWLTSQ